MIKDYDIYPLTISEDRYGGTYSFGKYSAWNLEPYQMPEGIFGDDRHCDDMWALIGKLQIPVGFGDTPEEACNSLYQIIEYMKKVGTIYEWETISNRYGAWEYIEEYYINKEDNEQTNNWFSVKYSLPEDHKNVLIAIRGLDVPHIAYVQDGNWYCPYDGDTMFDSDLDIMYWMPMPKVPRVVINE